MPYGFFDGELMAINLIASGDGQALVIRDHLLPLVRKHGTLEMQRDAIRIIAWQAHGLRIEHWTPFYELMPEEASSPGYRHAIAQQRAAPALPYGLDVWSSRTKVLSLLWDDASTHSIVAFSRGDWEREALAL